VGGKGARCREVNTPGRAIAKETTLTQCEWRMRPISRVDYVSPRALLIVRGLEHACLAGHTLVLQGQAGRRRRVVVAQDDQARSHAVRRLVADAVRWPPNACAARRPRRLLVPKARRAGVWRHFDNGQVHARRDDRQVLQPTPFAKVLSERALSARDDGADEVGAELLTPTGGWRLQLALALRGGRRRERCGRGRRR